MVSMKSLSSKMGFDLPQVLKALVPLRRTAWLVGAWPMPQLRGGVQNFAGTTGAPAWEERDLPLCRGLAEVDALDDDASMRRCMAIVVRSYSCDDPRMLVIHASEVLEILGAKQDWFIGVNQDGAKGYVPPSFLNPVPFTALAAVHGRRGRRVRSGRHLNQLSSSTLETIH